MNKEAVEILTKAKKILETNKWTKEHYAKKANGRTPVYLLDPQAKCFCMMGAIGKALNDHDPYANPHITPFIREALGDYFSTITKFNDNAKSKKEVLDLFDRAIELAKKA